MVAVLLAGGYRQYVPAGQNETWTVNGTPRMARVVAPSDATPAPPVVICFHGGGGQAYYAIDEYAIQKNWPEALVYYAQGLVGRGGYSTWDRKDVAFFDAMRSDALHRRHADPARIFVMGYSTGANFCGDLWALRGDRIAAFAFISGGRFSTTFPPRPVYLSFGEAEPEAHRLQKMGAALTKWAPSHETKFLYHPRHGGHTYPQELDAELATFLKGCPPISPPR